MLLVRGPSVFSGYLGDAPSPFEQHEGHEWYRTGDLVYRNDRGEIMFIGRRDYQIKHLGYRIELGEIENAVLSLPQIHNACVLYHRSRLEITLCFESPETLSPSFIRQQLLDKLPKYMLPNVFHQLEALPRNPNGKIDRAKLVASVN